MKVDFLKSETIQNLARSYAGECQAGARYQFIAKRAVQCGLTCLSDLMKTVAKNEMAHAQVFYNHIIDYGKTDVCNINIEAGYPFRSGDLTENLCHNVHNETEESERIYPKFADIAEKEGFLDVAKSYRLIASVENCHKMLNQQLHDKMTAGTLYTATKPTKWKCNHCGFEHTDKKAWDICPLCKHEQGFVIIPISDGSN